MARIELALVAALAIACKDKNDGDGDGGPAGPDCGPLGIELGQGALAYGGPAADGDLAQFVHGPQGGWHLETAGEVTIPNQEVKISPALFDGDRQIAGDQVADPQALVGWSTEGCVGTFSGVQTYIDDGVADLPAGTDVLREFICPLAGRTLRWTVTVTTFEGDAVSDEVEVVAVMDGYDVEICETPPTP